jgi:predicted ABC-type ATPase
MPNQAKIRIFAGPNGSGKTTLYEALSKNYSSGFFINADEIEKKLLTTRLIDLTVLNLKSSQEELDSFKQTPLALSLFATAEEKNYAIDVVVDENFIVNKPKTTNSYEASFVASFIRYLLLKNNKSFSYETVMSHKGKIEEIKQANNLNYKTYLYFVCTDHFEKNILRVKMRVEKGGHFVDEGKIKERYFKTLENLADVIRNVHRAYIFDNSESSNELIAEVYQGTAFKFHTSSIPAWFEKYVYDKFEF